MMPFLISMFTSMNAYYKAILKTRNMSIVIGVFKRYYIYKDIIERYISLQYLGGMSVWFDFYYILVFK